MSSFASPSSNSFSDGSSRSPPCCALVCDGKLPTGLSSVVDESGLVSLLFSMSLSNDRSERSSCSLASRFIMLCDGGVDIATLPSWQWEFAYIDIQLLEKTMNHAESATRVIAVLTNWTEFRGCRSAIVTQLDFRAGQKRKSELRSRIDESYQAGFFRRELNLQSILMSA